MFCAALCDRMMAYFDDRVGGYCREKNIVYTRYCDDMTFSGSFDEKELESYVGCLLCMQGFELNSRKTTCVSASQQQRVTGIVVNEKMQISSAERRRIRQEVYYLSKNTVLSCMRHIGVQATQIQYLTSLQGRISFALQINPEDKKMQEYYAVVHTLLKKKISEKRKRKRSAAKR